MLVLTRKDTPGEDTLVLVGVDGKVLGRVRIVDLRKQVGRVRIGLEFPSSVAIHREEVWVKNQTEGKQ